MKSLYSKFLLFTIAIMFTSALLSFLVVNTYYHQQLREKNDAKNMVILMEMIQFIQDNETLDLNAFLKTEAKVGYKLVLANEAHELTWYGEPFRLHNLPTRVVETVLGGESYHGMRDLPTETFVTGFFSDETKNTVGMPLHYNGDTYALFLRPNIKLLFTEVHYLLGGMFLFMALISMVSMLFVARKLIQPITALTDATKQIGAEQFSLQLPTDRNDEIGILANSFEQMAEQLHESDQMRKQFINDVSHDFQTPLQNINGYVALLQDEATSLEERVQYMQIIKSETTRLSALTKQLLLLTSLDAFTKLEGTTHFSITEQLKNVLQKARWRMEEKQITLTAEFRDITFYGHEAYMEKVWENLLSNALKYTPEGGTIHIMLTDNEEEIVVIFTDSGIGIKKGNIPNLFDRFYRVDEARQTNIAGTGLGLSIVKQVVDLHHGTVEVESTFGEGTSFVVRLPKR